MASSLNEPPTIILIQGPGPIKLIFANQFKRIIRVKIRVFILKVANPGLMQSFYERHAITRHKLTHCTVLGASRTYKTFFGLHLYLAGNYCKNPKVPGALLNVNVLASPLNCETCHFAVSPNLHIASHCFGFCNCYKVLLANHLFC